jgi:hypothetical protein
VDWSGICVAKRKTKDTEAAKRRRKLAADLQEVHDSPAIDRRWYASDEKPHDSVREIVGKLLQDGRRGRIKFFRDLYFDEARGEHYGHLFPELCARFNVIRSITETLHARHGKHQPKPEIHTVGGTWKMRRRAKGMGRYIDGVWEQRKADRMRRDALLDCLVTGEGDIKVFESQGKVEWARIRCENLLRHPREVKAGHVRTLYEVAAIDREVAAATWPDNRYEILNSTHRAPNEMLEGQHDEEDDLILIVEAWHLPFGQDEKGEWVGGRHAVITDGCTMLDEPWTMQRFPVVELHMTGDTLGRAGVGYPERLAGLQASQNRLAETAEEVARLMPPKYALIGGAQIATEEERWTNLPAEFIQCNGGDVRVLSANADLMACMQASAMQRAEMYRIEGISEDSATGAVPTNLDSGKAQLVHRDSGAERLIEMPQRVEEFTTDLCRLELDITAAIAKAGDTSKLVAYAGDGQLQEVHFADVSLGDAPVVVRVAAINKFANSPEGKHKQLMELMQAGAITLPRFQQLYELTDLEADSMQESAGYDYAMKLIDKALDGETVAAPRYCDKVALINYGWKHIALAAMDDATDEDLQPLIDLLGQVQGMIDQELEAEQAKHAASAPPPMPGGMPPSPGAPVPPPAPLAGPTGIVA